MPIRLVIEKYTLKNMVKYLFVAGVSRSGYYNYFSEQAQVRRDQQNQKDEEMKVTVLKTFHYRNRKKGARQIKMTLAGQFGTNYNLKRIRRIMKKYTIVCQIRKANPYRRMVKARRNTVYYQIN
jgi:putative transposase